MYNEDVLKRFQRSLVSFGQRFQSIQKEGTEMSEVMQGYVTLKAAATMIKRSTARTRQYVHAGQLGEWKRDEMGHVLIPLAGVQAFVPPERGEKRAGGVSSKTHLRHAKATLKLVSDLIAAGPSKATAMQVLNALVQNLAAKAAAEPADGVDEAEDIENEAEAEDAAEVEGATFDKLLDKV